MSNAAPQSQPNFFGRPGGGPGGPGRMMMTKAPKLKDPKNTLRRLGAYLADKKKTLAVVLVLALVTTITSIVGTRLNGYTIDNFIAAGDPRGLLVICLIMAGIYLIGVCSTYGQNILMISAAQQTAASIRRGLFARIQRLPLSFFDTHSSGDLMSRLTNDVDNINNALAQNMVQLFTSIITVIGMLIAMLLLSPLLTLVCLVTTPLTLLISRLIIKAAHKFFIIQQRDLGELNGFIEEMVSGQKVVRLFSREKITQDNFEKINARLVSASCKAQAISGVNGPCNNMINNFAYLLVAALGGACIIRGVGGITVGAIFSFLLYMRHFTMPINNILNRVNRLQLALASAERVFAVLDEDEEHDRDDAGPAAIIRGDIEMRQVDFSYPSSVGSMPGKKVLHSADISAESGQTVAIVGPTGAGKTTIINLLTKFYDFESGSITIDGKDIRTLTMESLRRSIAMVLQDTFLFSDTIRENIRYGRPDAGNDEVEQAARKAHAHEFITQLSKGYDTVLADNGQNLSQGQRQLISIARAIVSEASVLILDEATSSIDTRTELLIQNALLRLMKGKTSFVIAHRLSTIRNADKILVINDGHVVEQGTHDHLIAAGGFYAKLYNSQFKGIAI
jgi:ATP-binding cassette subfamily B protein